MEQLLWALGLLAAFAAFWCAVCQLIAWLGGWKRLAAAYPAVEPYPSAQVFRRQSGSLGFWSHYYSRIWTVRVGPEGLCITVWPMFVGHPPVFIPWGEIVEAKVEAKLGWIILWRRVTLTIGRPRVARLSLTGDAGRGVRSYLAERGLLPPQNG